MTEITTFNGQATQIDASALTDAEVDRLMRQVGERVRHVRERKGMPRRVLSEISGVSPRYLAQLESGEGNISISLLKRVALALNHKIEWLVGEEDPWNSDVLHMAEAFRAADRTTRAAVLRLLADPDTGAQRANRLCLVGLRGAGKSTLGRLLSAQMDAPFVELNRLIEEMGGMPVPEVMALYGPEGYRKLESDALDRVLATHDRVVLAVAGGIVAEPATYRRLLQRFHTIWIKASPQEHMDRVRAQGDERPMANNPEAMAQLRALLASRATLYEQAEATLDTTARTREQSLSELIALVAERGFLDA